MKFELDNLQNDDLQTFGNDDSEFDNFNLIILKFETLNLMILILSLNLSLSLKL